MCGSSNRFPRTQVTSAPSDSDPDEFWMHRFGLPSAAYRLYVPKPTSTRPRCIQSATRSFSSSLSSSFHTSTAVRQMATLRELDTAIAEQSALFNQLKAKADPAAGAELEAARVRLGELKKSRGALLQAAGAGSKDKKKERLLLKTAKVRRW
jgi:hypothetical protein